MEPDFPKLYRLEGRQLRWAQLGAGLCTLLAAGIAWTSALVVLRTQDTGLSILFATLAAAAVVFVAFVWLRVNTRITVWSDRVDFSDGLFTESIRSEEFRSYRLNRDREIYLLRKGRWKRSIKLPPRFWAERTKLTWFLALTDERVENRNKILQSMLSDARYGETHFSRQLYLNGIRRSVRILNAVSVIPLVCLVLFPAAAATIAAIAVFSFTIILLLWTAGAARLDMVDDAEDPRPSLWPAFALSGLLLFVKALNGPPTIGWEVFGALSTVVGFAFVLIGAARDQWLRNKPMKVLTIAILTGLCTYGALYGLNISFDVGTEGKYRAVVLDKIERAAERKKYQIQISPWGPIAQSHFEPVSADDFSTAKIGEPVCVVLCGGILRWQWYEVRAC